MDWHQNPWCDSVINDRKIEMKHHISWWSHHVSPTSQGQQCFTVFSIFHPQVGKSHVEIYGAGLGLQQPPSVTKSGNRRLSSYRTRQCFQNVPKLHAHVRNCRSNRVLRQAILNYPTNIYGKLFSQNFNWAWRCDLRNTPIITYQSYSNAFRISIWPFSISRCKDFGSDMQSTKDIEGLPYTILGFSSLASYSTWHWCRLPWAMAVQIGSENGAPENPIEYNGVSWISPDNSHSVDFCRYNTKYPPFLNKPRNLPRLWHWQGKQWNTLKHHFKNIENRWKKRRWHKNDIKWQDENGL